MDNKSMSMTTNRHGSPVICSGMLIHICKIIRLLFCTRRQVWLSLFCFYMKKCGNTNTYFSSLSAIQGGGAGVLRCVMMVVEVECVQDFSRSDIHQFRFASLHMQFNISDISCALLYDDETTLKFCILVISRISMYGIIMSTQTDDIKF